MPLLNHFATFCVKNVMGNAHIEGKVTVLLEHLSTWFILLCNSAGSPDGFLSQLNVAFEGLWHFRETMVQQFQWLSH